MWAHLGDFLLRCGELNWVESLFEEELEQNN